ncbi:MAG TPA: aminotransferase class V-fold PLP-dependent enzyme, partial [Thermoplasmata archaeon]
MTEGPDERRPPRPRSASGGFDSLPPWVGPSTTLVHGARRPELNAGAVVPPIYQTSTFHFPGPFSDAAPAGKLYLYSRMENPTLEVPAELVRRLEGAQAARVFGSGMGALSATLLTFLRAGDEVVALSDLYGGTVGLLETVLPRLGVRVRWVNEAEAGNPEAAVGPATRVVLLESPTNPLLRVHDLARWARAAKAVGAITVVDNTFATPINQRPIELGADLVVHSGTKYLGGHSDLLAGVVAGSEALVLQIDPTAQSLGSVLDPMAAFLLARGLRTLSIRMERHNENGRRVAEAIRNHRNVARVFYPGFGDAG